MSPATLKAPSLVGAPADSASTDADGRDSTAPVRASDGASSSAPTSGQLGPAADVSPSTIKGDVGADLSYERAPGFPHDGDYDLPGWRASRMPAGSAPAAPCLDCGHATAHHAGCRP